MDGHVFALSVAHDHLATTDAERVRLAAPMCRMVAYIVDAGFVLVDPVTGRHTTWGYCLFEDFAELCFHVARTVEP